MVGGSSLGLMVALLMSRPSPVKVFSVTVMLIGQMAMSCTLGAYMEITNEASR